MKKKTVLVLLLAAILALTLALAACTEEKTEYTVTFMSEGSVFKTVKAEKGKKISSSQVGEPASDNADAVFSGWYKDEACTSEWKFHEEIVAKDTTLYASWRIVSSAPTALKMAEEHFTSSLVWTQKSVESTAEVKVKLFAWLKTVSNDDGTVTYEYSSTGEEAEGSFVFDNEAKAAKWTPAGEIDGGMYKATLTVNGETATASELLFAGLGSVNNPYLLTAKDVPALNGSEIGGGSSNLGAEKFYRVFESFDYVTDRTEQSGAIFAGTLDGDGKTVTLSGNSGLFHKTASSALIYNLSVAGSVSTGTWESIGALVDFNGGTLRNCTSYANVTSTAGEVKNLATKDAAGAGGIVGTNLSGGKMYSCTFTGTGDGGSSTGVVKAAIGGGCIAGTNYGLISECVNKGCLGAYNSVESGKSLSAYSYAGGIVGFNYGTVEKSSTRSTGKLLAQRAMNDALAVEANNFAIGGIAGYNAEQAVITESYFEGIRVHGDQCVGGIAGINAGTISYSYSNGKYFSSTNMRSYIGGRLEVGGIAGRMEKGTVTNCFNTANVYSYSDKAYSTAKAADNSVGVANNHDVALNESSYGTPYSKDLKIAETGSGNVTVVNAAIDKTSPAFTENYKLSEDYLSTLGVKFIFDAAEGTVTHAWTPTVVVESIEVTFMFNGEQYAVKTVYNEEESEISVPHITDELLSVTGWAFSDGGASVFGKSARISYKDVVAKAVDGKVTLYALTQNKDEPSEKNALIVAIWTRYVPVPQLASFKAAFEAYLTAEAISVTDLVYREYSEASVDDFAASVNSDGDVDIILGGGGNIGSKIGASFVSKTDVTISGQLRNYAVLSSGGNTENIAVFEAFMATDEAKLALDPPPAVLDKTIVVGFYSTASLPFTSEMAQALKTAFLAYLDANSIEYEADNVIFREYIGTVAEMGTAVNAAGDLDIMLNVGANITTIGKVETKDKKTVTILGTATRYVARLTDNTLAVHFYNSFVTSAEAGSVLNPAPAAE